MEKKNQAICCPGVFFFKTPQKNGSFSLFNHSSQTKCSREKKNLRVSIPFCFPQKKSLEGYQNHPFQLSAIRQGTLRHVEDPKAFQFRAGKPDGQGEKIVEDSLSQTNRPVPLLKKIGLPSRKFTYPTWGKGNSSSNMPFFGDMLIPWRVNPFFC